MSIALLIGSNFNKKMIGTYIEKFFFTDKGYFNWIAITSIIAIGTFIWTIWFNNKKYKADLVSKGRIDWMNQVRPLYAQYLAAVPKYMCLYNKAMVDGDKLAKESLDDKMDEIKRLYEMFWEKSYVNIKIVVQNISMMKKNEKLYLYGAGRAAQELLGILAENDISIDGVFVTNIKNSAKTILGHKVLGIDTYVQSDKSTMFLVAITKKYVGNTIELLRSKGIENIIYVC